MRISDWSSDVCSSDLAIEDSNLNRLVGGTALDVKRGTSKVEIAKRLILAINPRANVVMRQSTWQEAIEPLKRCDIIIGGLESVRGKDELERFCRSLLIDRKSTRLNSSN